MSAVGQSRHLGPVRRMSAYPLTAAREQSFRDFGPKAELGEQAAMGAALLGLPLARSLRLNGEQSKHAAIRNRFFG